MSHTTEPKRKSRFVSRAVAIGVASVAITGLVTGCTTASTETPTSSGSTAPALSGDVVFADYGGPTNESRQIAYFDSFDETTGATVVSAEYADAVANTMLEGGEGDYDLIQTSTDTLLKYKDNLVPLPEGTVKNDAMPENIQDYAVGSFLIGITQGWLTDTYPDGGPQDWADFFDTTKFPGKRAWPGSPGSYDASYEIALLADGVATEDLYPIDFERATKKLDTIKDDLVFYESYPEVQTLLSSGTAAIAVSVTGQFTALQNAGEDVTVQWNQAFLSPNFFVVPAKAPNQDNAFALADWMADGENQALFTERTHYGPGNESTFDFLSEDVISTLPNAPDHTGTLYFDEQFRSDNLDTYLSNYTDWLSA